MKNIGEIDKRLAVRATIGDVELNFYNVRQEPFRIYGLLQDAPDRPFRRIPEDVARATSEGVFHLHTNTAGGRVRFSTDSAKIAIRAKMLSKCLMPHMPFTGSSGFDLYVTEGERNDYFKTFVPPVDRGDGYESIYEFQDRRMRDITINFPLYDNVDELLIGLEPDAAVQAGGSYRCEKPVIYYGSSITQGGCASRPGNSYQAMITRMLNCDHVNLGFSGNAKGELPMADYIAGQPMSLFFMDYDHNSPTPEYLQATHERLFLKVREANPDLPIIITSQTDIPLNDQERDVRDRKRKIIHTTYENAIRRGDRHVRFVDGSKVFYTFEHLGYAADNSTVDGCHPNDAGFWCMAYVFGNAIREMLNW